MARWRILLSWNTALLGAVFLLIADRFCKAMAITIWQIYPINLLPELSLTFSKNYALAFSLQSLFNPLFLIIPLLIILLLLLVKEIKKNSVQTAVPLFFIIAGAASNLYDRLLYGYVIDYIDLRYFTIFNIADITICLGVFILLKKHLLDK